jgi:tetratricopeptide (TPR) repeat protein
MSDQGFDGSAKAYYERGNFKLRWGDFEAAIADFTEAIRLDPAFEDAYNNRGVARETSGDYAGAVEDYTALLQMHPGDAEVTCNRGIARRYAGDFEGALQDYAEAIRLNPKLADAYYNRGILHDARAAPRALADYTRLGKPPVAKCHRAAPCWATPEALRTARRSAYPGERRRTQWHGCNVCICGSSIEIQAGTNTITSPRLQPLLSAPRRRLRGAIRAFNRVILEAPTAREYLERGLAYLAQHKPKKAAADFRRALKLHPPYT